MVCALQQQRVLHCSIHALDNTRVSSTLLLWWIRRNSRELRLFFGKIRTFSQFGA
jgi:hypothetical protein